MKLHARYLDDWEDEDNPSKVYKVRSLSESRSGIKRIELWGWASIQELDEKWELLVDGKKVIWE